MVLLAGVPWSRVPREPLAFVLPLTAVRDDYHRTAFTVLLTLCPVLVVVRSTGKDLNHAES